MTKTIELPVHGMTCGRCVAAVEEALRAVPHVESVGISLENAKATIRGAESLTEETLVAAIESCGYSTSAPVASGAAPAPPMLVSLDLAPSSRPKRIKPPKPSPVERASVDRALVVEVRGMHCASCVARVESALMALPGAVSVHANLAAGQAYVRLAANAPPTVDDEVATRLAMTGYQGRVVVGAPTLVSEESSETQRGWGIGAILAVVFLLIGVAWHALISGHGSVDQTIAFFIALTGAVIVGEPFFREAIRKAEAGISTMDTLVALGVVASLVAGALESHTRSMALMDGQIILAAVCLGRWLESGAKNRAWEALRKFAKLVPPTANVEREGAVSEIAARDVAIDETILVRAGERVPLDSIVIDGQSDIDESWLTGESTPVAKQAGDTLLAGSTNGAGTLHARVARRSEHAVWFLTTLRMREALAGKSRWQRKADRVVAWFVPTVLLIATLSGVAWLAADGLSSAMRHAAATLLVSCPCALGLATPVALAVAVGQAARAGIVLKNAVALERGENVSVVVFDKTGTLTTGKLAVVDAIGREGAQEWLTAVASVETLSLHPAAKAIVAYARSVGVAVESASQPTNEPGRGVSGVVHERRVAAGSIAWMEELDVAVPENQAEKLASHIDAGRLIVHAAEQTDAESWRWLGAVVLEDTPRAESRQAIAALQGRGLHVALLTGDRPDIARRVAEELGVRDIHAQATPGDKIHRIRFWQNEGKKVAMVGDGVNDGPALAAADLSIAMGSAVDLSLEAADAALPRDDVGGVLDLLTLSNATARVIRQNLLWAFAYNIVLIPLAAGVLEPFWGLGLPPAWSAAAMAASSVCVVANSLRLRTIKLAGLARSTND
jgi:P-type Cu+ transporter